MCFGFKQIVYLIQKLICVVGIFNRDGLFYFLLFRVKDIILLTKRIRKMRYVKIFEFNFYDLINI